MSGFRLLLLGVPEIEQAEKPLVLPTRKLLGLVAYLALEGPTPRAKLADLFWSESGEEGARGNLRRELNRLRHTPIAEQLLTERDLLKLSEVQTDVAEFWARLKAEDFETALALYRGPLLEGLELTGATGFEEWLFQKREELTQIWRNALSRQAEKLEASHDLRGALAARLELLREDELQELHHREVMRLHALLGEREAALERFERLRGLLGRELHLDPLPETVELAERIRSAQVAVAERPVAPHTTIPAAALNPPLIGRESEWAQMEAAWEGGKILLLSGEPGVGKTRLLQEFAASKGRYLLNQGRPGDGGIPYATLSRTVHQVLLRQPDLTLPAWVRRELARLLPQLSEEIPPPIGSPQERLRLFDAFAEFTRLATQGVAALVSDDLQFFDPESFEMGLYAAQRYQGLGQNLHLMAAFRSGELGAGAQRMVIELVASGQAVRIELQPLSEVNLLRLVRAMSGTSGTRFTQRLYRATGGNPLFVTETLKALFASGELVEGQGGWSSPYDSEAADYRELPLPASVREVVRRRVEGLGAAPQRLLEAASLAGDGFGLEELWGATALSEWESVEALEQSLAVNLLQRQGEGYAFSHDLVQRSIEEGLSAERKRVLHLKLAASLERIGSSPARVALHLEQGGQTKEAVPKRVQAAEASIRVFSHQEALAQYARAIELLSANSKTSDHATQQEIFSLLEARARIRRTLDDNAGWEGELAAMEEIAKKTARPDLEARLALGRMDFYNRAGRFAQTAQEAEQLQLGDLPPEQQVRALTEAGRALLQLGRVPESEAKLEQALEYLKGQVSERVGDIRLMLFASARRRGDLEAARQHNDAARQVFHALNHHLGLIHTSANRGVLAIARGDPRQAVEHLEQALALARETGETRMQRGILLDLCVAHEQLGDYPAALRVIREGLESARQPGDPLIEGNFLNNLGYLQRQTGDLGASLEATQQSLAIADRIGSPIQRVWRRINLADLLLELGQPQAAEPLLREAREMVTSANLGLLTLRAETFLAWLELGELGDPAKAAQRLETALAANPSADPEDRMRSLWLLGLVRLAGGEVAKAQETLSQIEARPSVKAKVWALEIRIKQAQGRLKPKDLEQAETFINSGAAAPLDRLWLCRAVLEGMQSLGLEPAPFRQKTRALVSQLAFTLAAHPDLKQSFLDHHQGLL